MHFRELTQLESLINQARHHHHHHHHHIHHWAAIVSRGWRSPQHAASKLTWLVLSSAGSCLSSICPGPVLSLHRLAGLPCRIFLSYGLQVVTREVHRSSLRRLICPSHDHLFFSHIADYVYDVCPPSDPDVGPSVLACDVERTSFHFGMCGRKFVLCLFGVLVSAPCYVIAGNTELNTCLFRQMGRLCLKRSR